jgi:excisionase family DNA binding protein
MPSYKGPSGPYLALAEALAAAIEHAVKEALGEPSTPAGNITMMSVPEAAQRMGIGRTKVNELIASGPLPSVVIGTRRLLRPADLEAFAAGLCQGHRPADYHSPPNGIVASSTTA